MKNMGVLKNFRELLLRYKKKTDGATAVLAGLTLPVLVGAVGLSVDMSMAYLVKTRLSHALDAAALAAAAAGKTGADLNDVVERFFNANYPADKIGMAYDLQVTEADGQIYVSARADYDTYFMDVLGVGEITVDSDATVVREVRGLEVALVLDVTGSMSTNDNIGAMKTASHNFLDILYASASDQDAVKVALVPYSTSVNVGPYGIGEHPDGSYYGESFMSNPSLEWNQESSSNWWGCVLAREYPEDTEDSDGTWEWDDFDARYYESTCSYRNRYTGERVYYTCNPYARNYRCNKSMIVPLTSDRDLLDDTIDTYYASGYTLGNYGMVWAYRMLSPEEPFVEGASYDDPLWQKAVIMMTDGNNTMTTYTAYGSNKEHSVSPTDLNERFEETCTNMKDDGIIVYTVTFTSGINDTTKGYYERCASDSSKYHDAPEQSDLIDVFEQISRELSNIHLKG